VLLPILILRPMCTNQGLVNAAQLGIFDTQSSTHTNQSSLAAILIWPDLQKSLYTAGDRDDPREQYIAAWSQCQGGPGKADHVTTVKAGHHGAATSTATDVLKFFNPENIIFSAGTDYGHPRKSSRSLGP
jgi:beta-lactamase superfamily II metal-dependent hydrolase